MENKQGFIPWSNPFHYNKLFLSSSSNSFQENPRQRLLKNHGDDYKAFAWMRIEAMSNANLQRKIVSLENEVVNLKAAMEKTEARAERASIQAAALEALVFELKSRLDSMPPPSSSSPTTLLPLNGQELEKIREKNTELEKKLAELTTSITHLKLHQENRRPSSSTPDSVQLQKKKKKKKNSNNKEQKYYSDFSDDSRKYGVLLDNLDLSDFICNRLLKQTRSM